MAKYNLFYVTSSTDYNSSLFFLCTELEQKERK